MLGRLWRQLGFLLAALVLAGSAPAAEPPSNVHRIVAIGDLHGDYAAWRDIARSAGLVDGKGRWSGGDTVLVQTGDVVDRGPDSLKIIQDIMRLQRGARRAGGRIVALVGNHEAMNVIGDLRYVAPADYAAYADNGSARRREQVFTANKAAIEAAYRQRDPTMTSAAIRQAWLDATPLGMIEHRAAWQPNGKIGRWVIGNPTVVLIDATLFVHGGIGAAYAGQPIAEINRRVAAALAAREAAPESIISDPSGPLWYRGLVVRGTVGEADATAGTSAPGSAAPVGQHSPSIREELGQVLRAYGAQRIVVGHTPILSGIAVRQDGRLVCIDTGISAVYGGKLSYLEIIDGRLIPHVVERSTPSQSGAE